MSNPNHIIIPVVRSRPTPEQLNVFQSSTLCLTPQKDAPFSKVLVDKKYGSAFKRYKQKKDRRDHTEPEGDVLLPPGTTSKPSKAFKLKIRHPPSPHFNKNLLLPQLYTPPYPFYDPNEAPLFVSGSLVLAQPSHPRPLFPQKPETIQEEIQVQLQQKKKVEPIEEEMQVTYVELHFRDDDPFIIIKKTKTKKTKSNRMENSHQKTKPIKKEKQNPQNSEVHEKKMKATFEREQKIAPIFQSKKLLIPPIEIKQKYSQSCDRPYSGETKANARRPSDGREIISLHHVLKQGILDDSDKSEEQVQIMEQFLITRAGVMS